MARHTSPSDPESAFKNLPESVEMDGLSLLTSFEEETRSRSAFGFYKQMKELKDVDVAITSNSMTLKREENEAHINFFCEDMDTALGQYVFGITEITYPNNRLSLIGKNQFLYQRETTRVPIKVLFADGSQFVNEENMKSIYYFILEIMADL